MSAQERTLIVNTLSEASYKSLEPSQILSNQLYIVDNDDVNRTVIASYDLVASKTDSISAIDKRLSSVEERYVAKDTEATSSAYGLVKLGYSENGKKYALQLDNGKAHVDVPWTDTSATALQYDAASRVLLLKDSNGEELSASLSSLTDSYVGDGQTVSISNKTVSVIDGVFQIAGDYAFTSSLTAYETQTSAQAKLVEAKTYTDSEIAKLSISDTYETKEDATSKLDAAKQHADTNLSVTVTKELTDAGASYQVLQGGKQVGETITVLSSSAYEGAESETVTTQIASSKISASVKLGSISKGFLSSDVTQLISKQLADAKEYVDDTLSSYWKKNKTSSAGELSEEFQKHVYAADESSEQLVIVEDNKIAVSITDATISKVKLAADASAYIKSQQEEANSYTDQLSNAIDQKLQLSVESLQGTDEQLQQNIEDESSQRIKDLSSLEKQLSTYSEEKAGEAESNAQSHADDLAEQLSTQLSVTVQKLPEPETSAYFATYQIMQGGQQIGAKINIPKDFLLKAAAVKECEEDDKPLSGLKIGDKYFDFTVNVAAGTSEETHLYVSLKDLTDVYVGSQTSTISVQVVLEDGQNKIKSCIIAGSVSKDLLSVDVVNLITETASQASAFALQCAESYTDVLSTAVDDKLQQESEDRSEEIEQSASETRQYAGNLLSDYYKMTETSSSQEITQALSQKASIQQLSDYYKTSETSSSAQIQNAITALQSDITQSVQDLSDTVSTDFYTKSYIDQTYAVKAWLSTDVYQASYAVIKDKSLYVCKEDNVAGAWNVQKWLKLDGNLLVKNAVSAAIEPYFRDVQSIDDMSIENLANAVSSVFELCK